MRFSRYEGHYDREPSILLLVVPDHAYYTVLHLGEENNLWQRELYA